MLALVWVAIVLTGCGGSGDNTEASNPCTPHVVTIQLFGDSTMAGYDTAGLVPKPPVVLLQEDLDARFGKGTTQIESRAFPGTTLNDLVAGTDHWNLPWPKSTTADIAVINHGINDLTHDGDLAGYKANLALVAHTPGVIVIFETPNKVLDWDLAPYAQAMGDTGLPVADTFAISTTDLLSDWAHPTQAGYEFIVKNSLAPVVAAQVSPLLCS